MTHNSSSTTPADHDEREMRCRRLGHMVAFGYCRCQADATPCSEVLHCWWETFDIASFLQHHLSPAQWARVTTPAPQPKLLHILDLVEQARQRTERDSAV